MNTLNLEISTQNPLEGISELIKNIRPQWKSEDIKLKSFTKGKVNTLIKCYLENDAKDAIIFRIYKPEMAPFIDRQAELQANQLISQRNYSPRILTIFNNGFCYQFVNGQTLDLKLVKLPSVWKAIACGLATIHSINTPNGPPEQPNIFKVLHNFVNQLPENLSDPIKNKQYKYYFPTNASLDKEISDLESHLTKVNSPIVYCHCDPRLENILWDIKTRNVTFIDFEFTDYNYQAYDIAAHFNSFAGLKDDPDFSQCPDETYQLKWLHEYLRHFLKNKNYKTKVSKQDVYELYIQATHMMLGISGVLGTALSTVDLFVYGMKRIERYFKEKEEVFNL